MGLLLGLFLGSSLSQLLDFRTPSSSIGPPRNVIRYSPPPSILRGMVFYPHSFWQTPPFNFFSIPFLMRSPYRGISRRFSDILSRFLLLSVTYDGRISRSSSLKAPSPTFPMHSVILRLPQPLVFFPLPWPPLELSLACRFFFLLIVSCRDLLLPDIPIPCPADFLSFFVPLTQFPYVRFSNVLNKFGILYAPLARIECSVALSTLHGSDFPFRLLPLPGQVFLPKSPAC